MNKFHLPAAPTWLWLGLLFFITACRPPPLACDDPLGCVVVRPNSPVQIATLLPVTGETAAWGEELTRGVNLAIAARGGELLDHAIELVPLDTACDPLLGQEAIQTLDNEDSLLGLIGPACSDVAAAILPTVQRNNWLMISPASSAPGLTDNQVGPIFFRTVPNHLRQAAAAAHFAYEQLGVRQTAVFQDETTFNGLLAQQFSDTFTELGGTVTSQNTLTIGQIQTTEHLGETDLNPPELIYLALFEPEATLLVSRLAEGGLLNQIRLLGSDNLLAPSFATGLRLAGTPGIFVTGTIFDEETYAAFLTAWAARHETLPTNPTPAYAYDATQLLLAAIEDVAIVGQTGALVIGREALRQNIAGRVVVDGVTGLLRCDDAGECAAPGYGVYEFDTAVLTEGAWPPPLVWQLEE